MDKIITQLFNNQLQLNNHIGNINNTEVFEGTYNNKSKSNNGYNSVIIDIMHIMFRNSHNSQ
jgi:hypothetical protein